MFLLILLFSIWMVGLFFNNFMIFSLFFSLNILVILFLFIFIFVSVVVFYYSLYYVNHSSYFNYYLILLFSFMFSILFLVISFSGLSLIIFWDLLGVTSFMLVIFYSNWDSGSGGLNTLLCNHLGDFFLILFFSLFIVNINSFQSLTPIFILFIIISAFTNSAQGPFIQWLPMAMSAPTPVSSLVHSSTLVTGGLFLVYLFYVNVDIVFVVVLSQLTFCVAGLLALFENDVNNMVAMSTLSQISFCMLITLLFYLLTSMSHMFTHALFKSCLFIQVGGLIYYTLGSQEGRNLVILNNIFQTTLLINVLSLCGLMYFSGIFTKDAVLLSFFGSNRSILSIFLFFFGVVSTLFYSFILLKSLFISNFSVFISNNSLFPIILCLFAVTGGVFFQGIFVFLSSVWSESYIMWILLIFFVIFSLDLLNKFFLIYKMCLGIFFNNSNVTLNNINFFDSGLNYIFTGSLGLLNFAINFSNSSFIWGFFVLVILYLLFF